MEFMELLSNISLVSIIFFLLGIGLIIFEMYQPGFGVPGSLGLISLIVCVFVTAQTVMQGIILTGIFFIIVLLLLVVFFVLLSKSRLPKKLVLHESEQGFTGIEDMQYLLGKIGKVVSICRPAGNVDFDGVKLDVVSRGEYIEKGATVEVVEIEGNRIVVKMKGQ